MHNSLRKALTFVGGHAGILIPLFEQNGELRVLLTQRSDFLSSHGGEVSFPGGKTDPGEGKEAHIVGRF